MNTENKSTETLKNQSTESNAIPEKMHFKLSIDAKTSDDNANAIETNVAADIHCSRDFSVSVIVSAMQENPSIKKIIMDAAREFTARGLKKLISEIGNDLKDTIKEFEKEMKDKEAQESETPNV